MNKCKIAFDIDGTIVDVYNCLKSLIERDLNKDLEDSDNYYVAESWNLDKDYVMKHIEKLAFDYNNLVIYDGVYKVLKTIFDKTQEPIQFVTSRPINQAYATHMLIRRALIDIPYQIAFAESNENKIKFLSNFCCFMEDRRKTAIEIADDGNTVFVPKHCYNEMKDNNPNIIKIDKFIDLEKYMHIIT